MSPVFRVFLSFCLFVVSVSGGVSLATTTSAASKPAVKPTSSTFHPQGPQGVTPEYAKKVFAKVNELVNKHFYDEKAVRTTWAETVQRMSPQILASRDLKELSDNINTALKTLKVSHTQFVTRNDETFYFLHTLFAQYPRRNKVEPPKIDFTGAVVGGVDCKPNEVRYILDGSPAEAAGLHLGDELISVAGKPYYGQLSFGGSAGMQIPLEVKRGLQTLTLKIKPVLKNDAEAYIEAIEKSAKVTKFPEGKIGYVHLWSGGEKSHDAFEEVLASELIQGTDALVLDLRDGYGGNYYDDLDFFYRPAKGYPSFAGVDRKGKRSVSHMYYDKPLVALINGGVRSGKELVAYSLQQTGRGKLVGEKTAGAVLGGRLFNIDEQTALYLAVVGIGSHAGTPTLEGLGVSPDVEIKATCSERGQKDAQREEAERILREQLTASKTR
jgi:carboxyl-terminal processing protease